MWNFLNKLRQKPDPQKQLIAFVSSVVITLIIAGTWLAFVLADDEEEIVYKGVEKRDPIADVTPLANIGSQFSEIKSIWGDVTSQFKKQEIKTLDSTTTPEASSEIELEAQ